MKKRVVSIIVLVCLLAALFPSASFVANAVTWITDRNAVSGSNYTNSSALAQKLDSIFDGNASIYSNKGCTNLVNTRIGTSNVPDDDVLKYVGPYGGPYVNAGTSCWIYANGVYYTLFGEGTGNGEAGNNSTRLNVSYGTRATYANFISWGVRQAPGALIRSTSGHSMIVLEYDNSHLTILDGNGNNNGLVSIRVRTWDEVTFGVAYIIQPTDSYFNSLYPTTTLVEPGIYTIHSARDWNKVLDIAGDSTASGANIQLYDFVNNDVQKFRVVKEGDYYCIQSVHSGMWLDVSYPYESWSNVQLWYTNDNSEEKWAFEDAGNGYVYIRNYYGNYVDLVGDSTENGTNVQLYHSKESDSQRWRLIPVAEPISVEPGIYTIHSARNWNKTVDIFADSMESGANIQLYDFLDNDVQKFEVIKDGNYYYIRSAYSGMWLDVAWPLAESRSNVQLYNENTNPEEKWLFEDGGNGYVYIRSYYGNYLDLAGDSTDNGTNIQVYHAKENDSQRWKLIREPEPVEIPEGVYTIHSAWDNGKVLDILYDSPESGANIQLYDNLNNDVQKFELIKSGNYYYIRSVYSGMWLDVAWPLTESRSNVQLFNDNTNPEEKWLFEDAGNGYVYIRNYYGNYLDIQYDSAVNYANVQVYHAKESNSQRWRLRPLAYKIAINGNGGTASTTELQVKYGENCNLSPTFVSNEGYTLKGWNLYRPADNKWFAAGIGWRTEEEIAESEYAKSLYPTDLSMQLETSWLNNADTYFIDSFTFYAVWEENSPPCSHNYIADVTPPTCTAQGYTTYTCSICNDSYVDDYVAATGHSFEDGVCTTCGFVMPVISAANADAKPGETITVPVSISNNCGFAAFMLEVTCDSGVTITDATPGKMLQKAEGSVFDFNEESGAVTYEGHSVIEDGVLFDLEVCVPEENAGGTFAIHLALLDNEETNLCDADGKIVPVSFADGTVEVEPPHVHTYIDVVTKPTCTEKGYTTHTCSGCGASYVDSSVGALGHDWDDGVVAPAPSCTEAGSKTVTCKRCDAVETQEVAALGHDLIHHEAKAPTCTEIGWEAYDTCSRCDYSTYVELKALDHDLIHHEEQKPTCTEIGWEAYDTCLRCDYSTYVEIKALDHDLIHHEAKAATCTEIGWEAYDTCSRCDYTTYVEIKALDHDLIHHEEQKPTCTEIGWKAYDTCSRCDYSTYVEIKALDHDLIHHEEQKPTCTEIGWKSYDTCRRCDYSTYIEIEALGHDLIHHEAQAQTCTEIGWNAYDTCSRCDYSTYVEKAALDHDYKAVVTAPTCTEKGYTTYTCTRCGDSYVTDEITANGHKPGTPVEENRVNPTCTETGSFDTVTYCSVCAAELTRVHTELAALDHAWDDGVIDPAATCSTNGIKTFTCRRCGEKKTETIAASGHTPGESAKENEVAATCTTAGSYDMVIRCMTCNEILYTEHCEIAALGHDWDDGEITTPATATTDGIKTFTCKRCGATKTEAIPATGEDVCKHESTHPEHKDATCVEAGYDKMICDKCGAVVSEETIPALGHDLVADEAVAATCTATGLTAGEHCTRCDYKLAQETVPALGHDWDEGKVTTPATETTNGVKTFTCKRCGATKTETIPATGGEDKPCDGGKDCPSYKFKDVNYGDWYHEAVDFAVKNGLFNGMSDTTFEPNTPMTRGMLVTVLWRYEGQPEGDTNNFADVKDGEWYATAVAWAASKGIVNGVGNGKFDPNGKITREQLAAILYRYSESKGFDTSKTGNLNTFPDAAKVSDWAKTAYSWAVGEGLIGGNVINGKTLLDPQGNATRAQVATILMRFIENIAHA